MTNQWRATARQHWLLLTLLMTGTWATVIGLNAHLLARSFFINRLVDYHVRNSPALYLADLPGTTVIDLALRVNPTLWRYNLFAVDLAWVAAAISAMIWGALSAGIGLVCVHRNTARDAIRLRPNGHTR